MGELANLKAEGKILNIGVSNFNAHQMARAVKVAPVASLQPPYSLLATEVEDLSLPFVMEHHLGVIVYSPMASGLLSGAMTRERIAALPEDDWRKRSTNFRWWKPCVRSAGEVAVAWTLRNPAVTAAIVGIRKAQQVEGVIGAADIRLSTGDLLEIEHAIDLCPA
jgi:aryl-alcohol dehydrogenase-like predicted oxidoreductase